MARFAWGVLLLVIWPLAAGYAVYRWIKDPWTTNLIVPKGGAHA